MRFFLLSNNLTQDTCLVKQANNGNPASDGLEEEELTQQLPTSPLSV
jgi:hypothetical protein